MSNVERLQESLRTVPEGACPHAAGVDSSQERESAAGHVYLQQNILQVNTEVNQANVAAVFQAAEQRHEAELEGLRAEARADAGAFVECRWCWDWCLGRGHGGHAGTASIAE